MWISISLTRFFWFWRWYYHGEHPEEQYFYISDISDCLPTTSHTSNTVDNPPASSTSLPGYSSISPPSPPHPPPSTHTNSAAISATRSPIGSVIPLLCSLSAAISSVSAPTLVLHYCFSDSSSSNINLSAKIRKLD